MRAGAAYGRYNGAVAALNPSDLTELERVTLGVLGAGLAPSSVAHDDSFRLDVLTATSLALLRGLSESAFLAADGTATAAFQRELSDAYYDLDAKRILGLGGPPVDALIMPGAEAERRVDRGPLANFAQHPTVFDRYLAGRCLDELLRNPAVYRYIMGKYAESSEVWQRVYRQYT